MSSSAEAKSALPDLSFEPTRGFFVAAARGELAIPRCAGCGRLVWVPKPRCPGCGGEDMPWSTLSGRGTLFSWARVERALYAPFRDRAPYVTGLVALAEDPSVRLVTLIVDCDPLALQMDMPVEVVFRELGAPEGGGPAVVAPCFRPASSGSPALASRPAVCQESS